MRWVKNQFSKFPLFTGIIAFLLAMGVSFFLSLQEYQLKQAESRQQIEKTAEIIEDRINRVISTTESAINILAYLIQNEKLDENFSEIGKSIIDNIDLITQIQYLDSGTIVASYPLKGNEVVLGYNILNDPNRKGEAMLAIERKDLFFAGPLELRQGGRAIVARLPLFEKDQFVGFAACIIDWEKFKEEVFTGFTQNSDFSVDLLKKDIQGKNPVSLLGNNQADFKGSAIEIHIPLGNWIIKVQNIENKALWAIFPDIIFRFILCLIFGFLIYKFAQQPYKLSQKVKETTRELQISNRRFELATQATSEIIWDWDLEQATTYRSGNFEKILGYSRDKFIETDEFWKSIIHPDDYSTTIQKLENAIHGNDTKWEDEFRVKRADGEYIYVIDKGIILRNKNGKATQIIGSTKDISAQKEFEKELQTQKQRLTNVIEGTGVGTWEWNVQTGDAEFNETWANLIGYKLEELLPTNFQNWIKLLHPEDIAPTQSLLNQYFSGEIPVYEAEFRMHHKNGSWVWIQARGKLFENTTAGKPLMMVGTHLDITEKKLREEELRLSNIRLQSANEELNNFASIASHDIKEPLRMISSFLQLLEKKYQGKLDEKGLQYIGFAVDGAKRLSSLIDDMMEYSRLGFDQSKLGPVNLNEVVGEVIQLKKEAIQEKNARIKVGELPTVLGIKTPLKSLFINLITNALKYQKEDTPPQISINSKSLGEYWQITIEDNGIGIEKDYYEKIFGLFSRLHGKNEYSGTGIGLAVCKKVVTQHGGRIWVESEPGSGSKFHFTIKKLD